MAQSPDPPSLELDHVPTLTEHLRETTGDSLHTEADQERDQSQASHDGGRAAWRLLLAAFVFEALLWGFPLSFGVFQEYYSTLPEFREHPYTSVIGTTASGISYIAAPFIIPLIRRLSKYRQEMIWVGWPVCLLGLVAASFSRSLETLILTQGIMYGLGFILFYYPILSMVNEFWIARRGMAYGLLCSASGVSGAVMPYCLNALLQKYGYPTTLRAVAAGLFLTTGPLIPLLKGRVAWSESGIGSRMNRTFLKKPLFWVLCTSNIAMGLGYFFPSLYLPSYASSNGLSPTQGATLLAIMSVSQTMGQLSFGYLSDRSIPLDLLIVLSMFTAAVAIYFSWGLAHNFEVMAAFSILYGFFGAGYTAMWARMGTAISTEPTAAFAIFGIFCLGKGIGNVLAGPISGALLATSADADRYGAKKYEAIVLFSGTCMLISAAIITLRVLMCTKWKVLLSSALLCFDW